MAAHQTVNVVVGQSLAAIKAEAASNKRVHIRPQHADLLLGCAAVLVVGRKRLLLWRQGLVREVLRQPANR